MLGKLPFVAASQETNILYSTNSFFMLSLLSLINADVNESASEASLSAQNSTYIYLTQPNFNQPN